MAITLLQLAEKVLKEEKRPLNAWEIWQVAENKGHDKLVDSKGLADPKGRGPSAYLDALMDADVKDNPSSIFVPLDAGRKRFALKSQMNNIYPGKKVNIPEHVLLTIDLGIGAVEVAATKGSIGTVLSYEEYSVYIDDCVKRGLGVHPGHLAWVKLEVEAGTRYPIRFEEVVQPSEDDYASWNMYIQHIHVSCQVGAINILPTESFAVI